VRSSLESQSAVTFAARGRRGAMCLGDEAVWRQCSCAVMRHKGAAGLGVVILCALPSLATSVRALRLGWLLRVDGNFEACSGNVVTRYRTLSIFAIIFATLVQLFALGLSFSDHLFLIREFPAQACASPDLLPYQEAYEHAKFRQQVTNTPIVRLLMIALLNVLMLWVKAVELVAMQNFRVAKLSLLAVSFAYFGLTIGAMSASAVGKLDEGTTIDLLSHTLIVAYFWGYAAQYGRLFGVVLSNIESQDSVRAVQKINVLIRKLQNLTLAYAVIALVTLMTSSLPVVKACIVSEYTEVFNFGMWTMISLVILAYFETDDCQCFLTKKFMKSRIEPDHAVSSKELSSHLETSRIGSHSATVPLQVNQPSP